VASQNQKIALVLRKKIATAVVNLIKNGTDASTALSDREIESMGNTLLTEMGSSILNMTLLASVGVDFNDLTVNQLQQIQKKKKPLGFMRAMKQLNMEDSEGKPIFDYFFEGTEINQQQEKIEFKKLHDRSKKLMERSLKYLIKGIKDEVKRKNKNKAEGSYIGNDLVSEIIADVLVLSLTGREDTSDEEDVFKATGLRKKMSSRSVFTNIYKEALRFRKKVAKADAQNSLVLGEGAFTWAKKSKKILGIMANFKYKVWKVVQDQIQKKTVSFSELSQGDEGDQEVRDRIVAEHYTELINTLADEDFDGDTTEKRELLASAKETYEEEEESEDTKKEYLLRILDMINSRHRQFPGKEESRFLLGNIEIISGNNSVMYKKIQRLVYARLFKMGQLTSSEIQFLDGAFTKAELDRQIRKVGKTYDLHDLLRNFDNDYAIDGEADPVELENTVDEVFEEMEGFSTFVKSLRDSLKYAPNKMFLKNDVALFEWTAMNYEKISDALGKFGGWLAQFESDADLNSLLGKADAEAQNTMATISMMVEDESINGTLPSMVKELLGFLQNKDALTPAVKKEGNIESFDLGDTQIKEFAHPLMSYSISEYPLSAKIDAGRTLSNVKAHAAITATDLRVHRDVTDYLSTDENFKSEVGVLREQRRVINQVVDLLSETKNFIPANKIKGMDKENKDQAQADNQALEETIKDDIKRLRTNNEGMEDLSDLFDQVEGLATTPKGAKERKDAVKKIVGNIQGTFDVDFGSKMRKLYEDNMDSAIDSLLQEVINTQLSKREIKGENVLRHRSRSSRVKSFLKRDAEMSVWVVANRDRLKYDKSTKRHRLNKALKEANLVACEAKDLAKRQGLNFDQACKDQGLTLTKGKVQIKETGDIRKLRSVLNALAKTERDMTVDTYITKAKAMTEKDVSDKIATSNDGLMEALESFSDNQGRFLLSRINSLLSDGFINKVKAPIKELKDLAESEFDRMGASIDAFILKVEGEKKDAKGDDLKELEAEITEAKAKKSEIMTSNAFNKLLDDFREMKILENVYTFEDRLGDKRMGEINEDIDKLTVARDKKLATLKKKDKKSPEELEEMRLIEAGEDEEFGKKLQRKTHYRQYGIAEEKASAVAHRSLDRSFVSYAPQVELKEESLRESARKMVDQAITKNILFDELGLGDTYNTENIRQRGGRGVEGVAELSPMASRTRSLRKLALLKKKYGDDNKFKELLDKDVDLRPLINVVEGSPECFPSVDLSLDHGLLKVYLAMPYYPQKVLVQSNGEFYGLKSENVFADPLVERNAQALMRYLLATSNPSILANAGSQIGEVGVTQAENPRLEAFYEKLLNSPSATVLKDMSEDYEVFSGDTTEEQNFADIKRITKDQESWWEGSYNIKEMLEAHKALKGGGYSKLSDEDKAKYRNMASVVILGSEGEASDEDIEDLSTVAFNVHQKVRYDTGSKKFFTDMERIGTLLGNGLRDHLSEGEMSTLVKDLTGTKAQKLIDKDILGEKYDSRLTGRLILNFTGLMADLNVLLACASSAVSSSEMYDLEIDEGCVEKVREVFGAEIGDLDKIIRKG